MGKTSVSSGLHIESPHYFQFYYQIQYIVWWAVHLFYPHNMCQFDSYFFQANEETLMIRNSTTNLRKEGDDTTAMYSNC